MLVWLCLRLGGVGSLISEGGFCYLAATIFYFTSRGLLLWNFMVSIVQSNKIVLGSVKGWFPSHCNPSSTSSQIHSANQLPTIFIGNVLLKSVQKPFSVITSDHAKFTAEDSGTESTSPVYQRGNNCPFIRGWIITFHTV